MKKIVYLFLLFIATQAAAQTPEQEAKKILDQVGTKVKASKGITAKITLKSISAKGKDMGAQSGNISMKANKYVLKKGKSEVVCDGVNVYTFDGAKTITVASLEESSGSLSPQKILSGSYDKDFSYTLVSKAGNSYQIDLKPLDARKNFTKASLFIDKKQSMITKAKVVDKTNNVTELIIANLNLSANLPDASFKFNKAKYPADVEVLD
ncbi:MAG: LolA family protein [Chitinophagaceae bacterium]